METTKRKFVTWNNFWTRFFPSPESPGFSGGLRTLKWSCNGWGQHKTLQYYVLGFWLYFPPAIWNHNSSSIYIVKQNEVHYSLKYFEIEEFYTYELDHIKHIIHALYKKSICVMAFENNSSFVLFDSS